MAHDQERVISAVTLAEAVIVADRRGLGARMAEVLEALGAEVAAADAEVAAQVGEVYRRWGKGAHPARLNIVDCFGYGLARARSCPLLYVGEDFAQTDVASALADPA